MDMEEIAISKFKAKCLGILERVRRTRRPVLVTRFGEPVAEIVPPSRRPAKRQWLGALRSTGEIKGDVVSPAASKREWGVLGS